MRWTKKTFSKRKQVTILGDARKSRTKGQGFCNLQEGESEEPGATVNAIIQFPELRTKS